MMKKIPITRNGFNVLLERLDNLKKIERPRLLDEIKKAREHGDLKENAEYHSAKSEQLFLEREIQFIENRIPSMQIVDIVEDKNIDKVLFGSTVFLTDLNKNENIFYQIVGEDETDIKNNKISIQSPLARALILKSKNDVIDFNTAFGIIKYRINEIKFKNF